MGRRMSGKQDIINLNGVDYDVAQMTESQQEIMRHIRDIDQNIRQLDFNLTHMKVARQAFLDTLAHQLQGGGSGTTNE